MNNNKKIKCVCLFLNQPLFRVQGRNPQKNCCFLVKVKTPKYLNKLQESNKFFNIELFCGWFRYHNRFYLKEKHFKSKHMKHLALLPLTFAGLSDFWAVSISPEFGLVMVNHPCSSLCSTIHFCTSLLFVAKDSKSTTEPDFGVKLSIPNTLDEFLVSITPSAPGRGNVH